MINNFEYWLFESVIDSSTCERIIKLFKKPKLGKIGKDDRLDKKKRQSDVCFDNTPWLYEIITPFINAANEQASWNADIVWNEHVQLTRYTKNQHYDWHIDALEEPYGTNTFKEYTGKIRKLSLVMNLTDHKKYEGGDFYFAFHGPDKDRRPTKVPESKKQGSILVFPSFVWHKVSPVTKGTRYSLVNWSLGPPWK